MSGGNTTLAKPFRLALTRTEFTAQLSSRLDQTLKNDRKMGISGAVLCLDASQTGLHLVHPCSLQDK